VLFRSYVTSPKQRSDAAAFDLLLSLPIMSEVQCACGFGLAVHLKYIWGILSSFYGYAEQLYSLRHERLLARVGALLRRPPESDELSIGPRRTNQQLRARRAHRTRARAFLVRAHLEPPHAALP
jgi:hypothetical protein